MSTPTGTARTPARSLDEALAEIWMRCEGVAHLRGEDPHGPGPQSKVNP